MKKDDYIDAYKKFELSENRTPREELINNVFSRFSRVELRSLAEDEFRRLIFVYSPENEVASKLTNNGNNRLLKEVVNNYIEETEGGWTWDANETKIKPMLLGLRNREVTEFPPIFLRERFSNEPTNGSFYIEDGIHRSLALAVFLNSSYNKSIKQKAYIGYF